MSSHRVTKLSELHRHLDAALQLEHATIPPYLVALYSIHPGTNSDAYHVLRAVVVEEMLHLTLAANILNAIGGDPDLTREGFVPAYPAYLPDGETDFAVSLQSFSKDAVETFLKIERPAIAAGAGVQTVHRSTTRGSVRAARVHDDSAEHFYSIGEFYQAIEQGLVELHAQRGDALFSGDPSRQITPEYYYSGGAEVVPVTDLESARAAIRVISEQGEGLGGGIFDFEDEIAHYYRFEQLVLGRYYLAGDAAGNPTGGLLDMDWQAVYPVMSNARLADYPEGSDLRAGAAAFNAGYADFLGLLTRAFHGEPGLLLGAVGAMFAIKEQAYQLIRQPINGANGPHAVPTFEMPAPTVTER
jgi:Ferritin-like